MSNTIKLKGVPVQHEAQASGATTPGDLVELKTTGKVGPNASANTVYAEKAFALENDVYAGGLAAHVTIDTAYALDDRLIYGIFRPGDEVNALLNNDVNADIAIGEKLMQSAVAGKLTGLTGAGAIPVAVALEAINNTAGGAPVRIKARIL